MAIIKPLFSQKTQTTSGSRVIPSLFKAGTNIPADKSKLTTFTPTPSVAPIVGPVQITPTQKKVDLNQIGSNVISKIKQNAPLIVKGLSFAISAVTNPVGTAVNAVKSQQVQKPKEVKVETPKAKPVLTKQAVVDSFKKAFSQTPAGAAITTAKKMPDFFTGFFGESSADAKRVGTQNTEAQPDVKFTSKNADQSLGVIAYSFLKDLTPFNAGGAGQSLEMAGKSALASNFVAPKVAFVQEAVAKFASKEFSAFLNKLSPIKFTIQDLRDVNGVGGAKATTEQLVKFQKITELADQMGVRITDLLTPAEKMGVKPTTTIFDFLKTAISDIVKGLKSTLNPEEQKLLGSGAKSKIEQVIGTGEQTSQEIIGKVIANGLEKTPEGKQIIKLASEAQAGGQNIVVDIAVKPVSREIIKLDKTNYPGIESGMAIIRPDKTASLDVRFVQEAQGKGQGTKAVAELEQKLIDKGIKTVKIESLPDAVGFWEKQGYKPTGEIVANQNVEMSKTLDAEAGMSTPTKKSPQITAKPKTDRGVVSEAQKETQPIVGESGGEDLSLVRDALESGDEAAAKDLYSQVEGSKPTFESLVKEYGGLKLKSIAEGEKKIDELLGTSGGLTGEWKKDYYYRQEEIRLMKDQAPPEIVAEVEKIENAIAEFRNVRQQMAENKNIISPTTGKVLENALRILKTINVSRDQLPVKVIGEKKVSRLEARVTDSLAKMPQDIIDQLGQTTYNQMNKKENIQAASEYVAKFPNDALKILRGEKEAPTGILRNSLYIAMENEALTDVELARKLASLSSTRMGQEISILTEANPNSPVKIMKDLIEVREKAFEKKYNGRKVKEVVKNEVERIKKEVKVANKYDWNSFVDSIDTC